MDLLTVFLMEPMILSTALISAWCLGRVTLNSMVEILRLRDEITFISVLIRSLPALTMLSPESIQMIRGVPLSAKVLQNSHGDALSPVVVEDLQVNSTTGEAQDHKNPSLQLEVSLVSKDGSKDVRLAEGERRLGGLEDVRDISLEI